MAIRAWIMMYSQQHPRISSDPQRHSKHLRGKQPWLNGSITITIALLTTNLRAERALAHASLPAQYEHLVFDAG